jgi:hypothetical protein
MGEFIDVYIQAITFSTVDSIRLIVVVIVTIGFYWTTIVTNRDKWQYKIQFKINRKIVFVSFLSTLRCVFRFLFNENNTFDDHTSSSSVFT